jgi:predicted nucleotidyltransferase component of viral defense system
MNPILEQMVSLYKDAPGIEKKTILREIIQELVLSGLSRAGFFNQAAFYGGTALRIFHGLDRFSEDLDFSLMDKTPDFDLSPFLKTIEQEVNAYGLNMRSEMKLKTKESAIHSAFLKGNTKEHLILLFSDEIPERLIHPGEIIRVKIEVDVNPPDFANFERKYRLLPIPYEVNLYDLPSLFAGKIHAVLCRTWKSRVKGRDLYDYIFFLAKKVPVNLAHVRCRLIETGAIDEEDDFSLAILKAMLREKFDQIDMDAAKVDVAPFLVNQAGLQVWSSDFFIDITESLSAINN